MKDKILDLLKSRKFWGAVAALVLIIVKEFVPNFPFDAESVQQFVNVIMAWIVGQGIVDAGRAVANGK